MNTNMTINTVYMQLCKTSKNFTEIRKVSIETQCVRAVFLLPFKEDAVRRGFDCMYFGCGYMCPYICITVFELWRYAHVGLLLFWPGGRFRCGIAKVRPGGV